MNIVNRRNAVMGWVVWNAAKQVGKRKARQAKPSASNGRPNKPLVAVALAAAAGATAFLRSRRSES